MRPSHALVGALAALACLPTAGSAQIAPEPPEKVAHSTAPAGEEAASAVSSEVLARCRQQAEDQKLEEGPARTAFMGTCITPED